MPPKIAREKSKGHKDLVNNAKKLKRSGRNLISSKPTLCAKGYQVQKH